MGTNLTVTPQTPWGKRQRKLSSSECTLLVSGTNKYTATEAYFNSHFSAHFHRGASEDLIVLPVIKSLFQNC